MLKIAMLALVLVATVSAGKIHRSHSTGYHTFDYAIKEAVEGRSVGPYKWRDVLKCCQGKCGSSKRFLTPTLNLAKVEAALGGSAKTHPNSHAGKGLSTIDTTKDYKLCGANEQFGKNIAKNKPTSKSHTDNQHMADRFCLYHGYTTAAGIEVVAESGECAVYHKLGNGRRIDNEHGLKISSITCSGGKETTDCKVGCKMWLLKSSLNYDSPTNWKKGDGYHTPTYENHKLLRKKCRSDCLQGKLWKSMNKFITTRTSPKDDQTPTDKKSFNVNKLSYWKDHVGHEEKTCQKGCNHYYQCMPDPPTSYPTSYPTTNPTPYPTPYPTAYPTGYPTSYPTAYPTSYPTSYPTAYPTSYPTSYPTAYPTSSPTPNPTPYPTAYPTKYPTSNPTNSPTPYPTASPTAYPTSDPTPSPTPHPTSNPTAPPTTADLDGIPLTEFKNWKCWRGYPGYAWKSRHHVHTIAMSGEVGSGSSGDQTKTIKNTDTHDHDHKKAGALEDDTLDGCIEHALHHHFAGLTTQGVTFACHGGSQTWTTVGYKRCEVHTTTEGDSMTTPYGKDHANMGKSGSSSHNYGMVLKGKASHVTCLRNEDVHDHWGSSYDSAEEMTLQQARAEYVGCRSNGRTDSGKTHQQHSAHHYDSSNNHLRR